MPILRLEKNRPHFQDNVKNDNDIFVCIHNYIQHQLHRTDIYIYIYIYIVIYHFA